MGAQKVQHPMVPIAGPEEMVLQPAQLAQQSNLAVGLRIGPARRIASADLLAGAVDYHVFEPAADRVELFLERVAVGTDAADIAGVAHVHDRHPGIEKPDLAGAGGRVRHRGLLAGIVECAEGIGRRVNRGCGD